MESGYYRLGRFGNAPIRIHWSAPLGAFVLSGFRWAPVAWAVFVGIILVHELGHALFVRAFRLHLLSIDVHGLGGVCQYAGTPTPNRRALIAWGGVLAQSVVLFAALIASLLLPPVSSPWAADLFHALIQGNLWLIAINLMPIPGFDGAEAWKLFSPARLKAWWSRRSSASPRPPTRPGPSGGVVRNMPPPKRRFVSNDSSAPDDILENTPTHNKRPPKDMLN